MDNEARGMAGAARRVADANTKSAGKVSFITRMIADGQWAGLDAAYVFDASTDTYVDLTGSGRDLTVTETVTLMGALGAKGDGVTGKLLGIGNASALTRALQDDCAVSLFVTKAGNQTAHLGRSATGSGQFLINAGPATISARLHTATAVDSTAVENTLGATTVWRAAGDAGKVHFAKDASYLGSVASTSAAPAAQTLAVLNNATAFCTDTVFAVLIGKGVTQAQATRRNRWLRELAVAHGWNAPPAVVDLGARNALTSAVHADGLGSAVGKGITGTGLCPDGSGGFWVGIGGTTKSSDTTSDCGVRHMNADRTVIADYLLAAPGSSLKTAFDALGITDTSQFSVQGVACLPSGNALFLAKDTVSTNSRVVEIQLDGTYVRSFSVFAGSNGLAYDRATSLAGVLGTSIGWRNAVTGLSTARPGGVATTGLVGGSRDHIWITDDGQWMIATTGVNDTAGVVEVYSLVNEWNCPVRLRTLTLTDTRAIEGACIVGDALYVNSDQYFHEPTGGYPGLNLFQSYSAAGLIA